MGNVEKYTTMQTTIIQHLTQLEETKKIKILLACETGSRAWGFPSPDSDYDVRFIYKHHRDWYLQLETPKDDITQMKDEGLIDLSGWDLRKALLLLKKSNISLLERLQSPMIYYAEPTFLEKIQPLAAQHYSRIAALYHYLSMAKNTIAQWNTLQPLKLKSLFYALRAAVACQWILEKDNMPPIFFPKMLTSLGIPTHITSTIETLINLKATKNEDYWHQWEAELYQFMSAILQKAEKEASKLPSAKGKKQSLTTFFIETIS
ncbi:MAG: nucleotidyltransferase domain-containing protein [Cytophagales bacterium]|nr:MAG: nucleotidyltransferase domain-containing protein [Cytophagales bacterium]